MSADVYAAVLADLREKRDGLTNLIAALENVARLNGPLPPAIAAAVQAEAGERRPVRPSVRPSVRTGTVPARVKAKPDRRATVAASARPDATRDAAVVAAVTRAPGGIRAGALEAAFPPGTSRSVVNRVLARLVEEGRIVRRGSGRGSRYWPAGTSAKEAVRRAGT